MNSDKTKKIKIKDEINIHLSLRDSADLFFDEISLVNKNTNLVIDFEGIKSISRSFAQQFLYRVEKSENNIKFVNEPNNIKMMFDIIKAKGKKPNVVVSNSSNAVNLSSA
ncbi:hypothetical protein [Methanosalsum natronophilum]|uniref:hypothetical protein n=1 Tax=Methanosalsum natronophilum TaxID=768733 RepID=UPI0021692750|nr:hypothetical protein [Methanosalsum natronophilum]MCS3924417.1 anti-anti-sigma regulatory factor [Methanosalsum natronophilum]